jgi:hypothetical protein
MAVDGPLNGVHQIAPEMAECSGAWFYFSAEFRAEEIRQTSHAPNVDLTVPVAQDYT